MTGTDTFDAKGEVEEEIADSIIRDNAEGFTASFLTEKKNFPNPKVF